MSFLSEFWEAIKTNAAYRGKVREVLMSREAANINFTALTIQIRGTIFPTIANDILGNNPTRYLVVQKSFANGTAAVYDTSTNVMEVGLNATNSRIWKGFVVHEAVHAWIDRNKLTPLEVDNEAVAYIAQAIYYRRVGVSRARFSNPIYLAARDVGNSIINGQTPSNQALTKLKTRILADPAYSHITATSVDTVNDG
jgi:hypothetical protein